MSVGVTKIGRRQVYCPSILIMDKFCSETQFMANNMKHFLHRKTFLSCFFSRHPSKYITLCSLRCAVSLRNCCDSRSTTTIADKNRTWCVPFDWFASIWFDSFRLFFLSWRQLMPSLSCSASRQINSKFHSWLNCKIKCKQWPLANNSTNF